jgi:hypothetical protein
MVEDRVQLPGSTMAHHQGGARTTPYSTWWPISPARATPAHLKLVHDLQIATGASAFQDSKRLDGDFTMLACASATRCPNCSG